LAFALPRLSLAQAGSLSDVLKRLEELEANQKNLEQQIKAKDAQIEELKSEPNEKQGAASGVEGGHGRRHHLESIFNANLEMSF
jgi:hypothetical protein